MKRRFILHFFMFVFGFVSAACQSSRTQASRPRLHKYPYKIPPGAEEDAHILGIVNRSRIEFSDLDDSTQAQIRDLENESAQRKFHLLWIGYENAIGQRLLNAEAKNRKISLEQLLKNEVDNYLKPVTDDDVRNFYDLNKNMIPMALEVAAPFIKQEIQDERRDGRKRAFIDSLRKKADIEYAIVPPLLPRYSVEVGNGPSVGSKNAPIQIVEFSDFQCSYCGQARRILDKLREMYPEEIRLQFRHLPLAQHANARLAAKASQCAFQQGKFWAYHDILFDHASALEKSDIQRYAIDADLDSEEFDACLQSETVEQDIAAHEKMAAQNGVRGTPAIFINGIKLVGVLPLPLMQALVEAELEKK